MGGEGGRRGWGREHRAFPESGSSPSNLYPHPGSTTMGDDGVPYIMENSDDLIFFKAALHSLEEVVGDQQKAKADCKLAYMNMTADEDSNPNNFPSFLFLVCVSCFVYLSVHKRLLIFTKGAIKIQPHQTDCDFAVQCPSVFVGVHKKNGSSKTQRGNLNETSGREA